MVAIVLAAAGFAAATLTPSSVPAADAAQRRSATTVTVTATEFKFKLSKREVPVGVVVFHVVNRGRIEHNFKIAGKKTPLIKPGKSATLRIVFKKKGRYAYLCTVSGHAALGMKGVLAVGVAAPPPPRTTPTTTKTTTTTTTTPLPPPGTVQVAMFEFGFRFTPSTIPAGTVTFVMRNTGTTTHNFDIEGVKAGPLLDAGQSATMTVNLQAGQTYTYECDVPGHADEGMIGTFTATG
jgi:uncharacterized cupredoxin-like copper-binding protein